MRTVTVYYLETFVAFSNKKPEERSWMKYYSDSMGLSNALAALKARREADPETPYRLLQKTTTYEVFDEEMYVD